MVVRVLWVCGVDACFLMSMCYELLFGCVFMLWLWVGSVVLGVILWVCLKLGFASWLFVVIVYCGVLLFCLIWVFWFLSILSGVGVLLHCFVAFCYFGCLVGLGVVLWIIGGCCFIVSVCWVFWVLVGYLLALLVVVFWGVG